MILVAGCSYACGEWARGDLDYKVLHSGLTTYIEEHGHEVTKLCIPAGSNLQVAHLIQGWLDRNPDIVVNKIFIFQTEYTRDLAMNFDEDWDKIDRHDSLCNIMIARFYNRLIEVLPKRCKQVYLIGGTSDTLDIDLVKKEYAPLEVACQSMINLMVDDNDKIKHPVFSWYDKNTTELIKKIKKRLSSEQQEKLLTDINCGLERESVVFSNPAYFWPDGSHPNRVAHKKLFDFLVNKGFL
jgi:hypothetical protein